jgi:hypothetical protein
MQATRESGVTVETLSAVLAAMSVSLAEFFQSLTQKTRRTPRNEAEEPSSGKTSGKRPHDLTPAI